MRAEMNAFVRELGEAYPTALVLDVAYARLMATDPGVSARERAIWRGVWNIVRRIEKGQEVRI